MIDIAGFPPIQPDTTRLVLEAGPCNNDLKYALDAVDAAAQSGAWGFKVQLYRPESIAQKDALRYDRTGGTANTQREAFAGALKYDQWHEVKEACDRNGLVFFASPFDFLAVDVLEEMGVLLYKTASGDITHKPLLQRIADTGKPMIVSTGGSELAEVRDALQWIQQINPHLSVCLLVCTLSYPCNDDDAHLNRITTWREAGQQMIGYSDHTRGVDGPLIAAQLGAVLVEKHFTLEKGKGYDSDFAVDPLEAAEIVNDLGQKKFLPSHPMFGLPDIGVFPAEHAARRGARRSIVSTRHIFKGDIIRLQDVDFLRPAGGLAPWMVDQVVGKRARKNIFEGDQIGRPDFTPRATATLDVF